MANDVVALNNVTPDKVYFPFGNDAAGLDQQIKEKMRGANDDAKSMVRALAPYKGGNEMLRAIHDLDIQDKHIAAIQIEVPAESEEMEVKTNPPRLNFSKIKFVELDPKTNQILGPPKPGFKRLGMVEDTKYEVVISKDLPLGGKPVIATLDQLANLVEGIIQMFETHFLGTGQSLPMIGPFR